ncbi:dermonecrotic toxin domain-containing protein [Pseudomonas sp. CFBP13509]|uniref:dermonecrotic toxin domain-containing protein n=1 Tax=Pseudomonas sp. CFBP13509 TaxID=2184008 RepID=UPI001F54318E|nr:DUF6543 domain-containing protein [Pseudomonas sp. CFBP13509]
MYAPSSKTTSPIRQYIDPVSSGPINNSESAVTRASQDTPGPSTSPHETALLNEYLAAVQSKVLGNNPGLIKVPPESNLGQWLEVYRAQLQHPVVQGWMRDQKIDQNTLLTVNPRTGTLTAMADGNMKTFSLTDNSGWGQVSRPLLEAAKIIAPGTVEKLQVRFGEDYIQVRAGLVANFQGERLPTSLAEARTQIRRLEHNKAFDPIPPDDPVRPANQRSAQALEQLKLSAETFYTHAPQALAYKHLAVEVAETLPNVRAQAKQWAESVIFNLTGKHVDADTLYLNRFNGSQSASTATGWEHKGEEPTASLRLPDALLKNFSENDWVPGNLDSQAGLYIDGPGKSETGGYGAHNQFPLAPSVLMHTSWKTDFQSVMTQKIDDFWNTHSNDYQTAIKGEFAYQARKQLKTAAARPPAEQALQAPEYRFTREDYRLVMGAASNLPLDENAPINVEQLKAEAPVKGAVQAHAFNIKGFLSNDIVRFSAADGGRQVLYIPGSEPAFLRFDSLEKLDQWVIDQTKDPKKRESLMTHFPLIARQDHEHGTIEKLAKVFMPVLWFTNVGSKTEGLDSTFEKLANGKLTDPTFNGDGSHLKGDVFSAMTSASKERMTSDADVMIKSNSEVTRDTWLNDITVAAGLLAKLAPIAAPVAVAAVATGLTELALGAEKQASGDTLAERNDGASKAFDGLLNTLFSVGASGSAEDPFIPPGEKPLTPTPDESPWIERPRALPGSNRLQPSQAGNITQYGVPNGEQLIERAVRNAKGIYQVKDATTGLDQWFIRYTDETGIRQVFEIKGDFKLSNDYVQIIDPGTGKPVMTVHANGEGDWVRMKTDGGAKWPWQREPSPNPSNDLKVEPKLSDGFEILGDPKTSGADKFDEIFKYNSNTAYQQSVNNLEEAGVLKRKLTVSWTVEENSFEVFPDERAQPNEYGSTDYSPNFIKDLNRDRYTVRIKQPEGHTTFELDATGTADGETLRRRLQQFEEAIPDANMRSRISEVAHQGSVAPASVELKMNQLQEHVGFKGKDTHYIVTYDPTTKEAQVTVGAQMTLLDLDKDAAPIPNTAAATGRTFHIRESNDLEEAANPYAIDKSAPFTLRTSIITDQN